MGLPIINSVWPVRISDWLSYRGAADGQITGFRGVAPEKLNNCYIGRLLCLAAKSGLFGGKEGALLVVTDVKRRSLRFTVD
jgi:hypothetical protein